MDCVPGREQELGSIYLSLDEVSRKFVRPVVALGFFDGVHIGHRTILDTVREKAARVGGTSLALTFDRHPDEVVAPDRAPKLLTTLSERVGLLEEAGIDVVIAASFTPEFASQTPEEFVQNVLIDKLGIVEVVAGYDYRFGACGKGNMEVMGRLGEERGFAVTVVGPVEKDGQVISSTLIRNLLSAGEVERAAQFMAHNYRLSGTVINGEKRARVLGFPTANLQVVPEKLIPADGVYAVKTYREVKPLQNTVPMGAGVLSISRKPTFGGRDLAIEVHVLDVDDDFYGQELSVEFVTRLRPIFHFETADQLIRQVKEDIQRTRQLFALL